MSKVFANLNLIWGFIIAIICSTMLFMGIGMSYVLVFFSTALLGKFFLNDTITYCIVPGIWILFPIIVYIMLLLVETLLAVILSPIFNIPFVVFCCNILWLYLKLKKGRKIKILII